MSWEKVRLVYPVFVAVVQVELALQAIFEIIISSVQLPTDQLLDVLLVRFPLGVIPKTPRGETSPSSSGCPCGTVWTTLWRACILLFLLLLLVASIAAAMVISFPPVRSCSSGVCVFPLPNSCSSCCPAW